MSWQEIVLAIGQIVFIIALLPSIFSKDKPDIWTSILTGTVALSISITYTTLSLKAAAISAFFNFVAWSILAIQKFRLLKKERVDSSKIRDGITKGH
jgi:hypothetical protein